MTDDQFPEIAAAVRHGINDAYRLGLGAAIRILCEYRAFTTDPATLDAAMAHMQHLSLHVGSEEARP